LTAWSQARFNKALWSLSGFINKTTRNPSQHSRKKVAQCRIFDDANGVMNESVIDQQLDILSISQFTLYADTQKGNRPSYADAAKADVAAAWYDAFNQALRTYCHVETGVFGANMQVALVNDGPVTIHLEVD
jgi:D-aminoacyl-tRNA deacylase